MIYALVTFLGVLFFGGIMYFLLDQVYTNLITQLLTDYPTYFANTYVSFMGSFLVWVPILIVVIAMVSAFVIELRSRNPDAYI
jgi:predicted PurR-regulated permease PerM